MCGGLVHPFEIMKCFSEWSSVAHEKLISNKMQFMNIKDQVDHKAGRECVHKIDRGMSGASVLGMPSNNGCAIVDAHCHTDSWVIVITVIWVASQALPRCKWKAIKFSLVHTSIGSWNVSECATCGRESWMGKFILPDVQNKSFHSVS